jgi:hypothetical protein
VRLVGRSVVGGGRPVCCCNGMHSFLLGGRWMDEKGSTRVDESGRATTEEHTRMVLVVVGGIGLVEGGKEYWLGLVCWFGRSQGNHLPLPRETLPPIPPVLPNLLSGTKGKNEWRREERSRIKEVKQKMAESECSPMKGGPMQTD